MRSRRWNQPSLGARLAAYAGLAFMHLPVLVIILYAFTTADRTYEFPPPGLTLHWFAAAFARADIWEAMRLSLSVAAVATLLAILLGSLTAGAGGADGGAIEVTHADLDLPVESRLAPDGRCLASLPRGLHDYRAGPLGRGGVL